MTNSYKFFENKDCKYYPCHKNIDHINCLFCYCPLYHLENCPGKHSYITYNDKKIKNCEDCSFPHMPNNYDVIMEFLSK